MNHEEFFSRFGNDWPSICGDTSGWTVSDLYQAFRDRLVTELNEAHERNRAEFRAEIERMRSAVRHAVNGTEP